MKTRMRGLSIWTCVAAASVIGSQGLLVACASESDSNVGNASVDEDASTVTGLPEASTHDGGIDASAEADADASDSGADANADADAGIPTCTEEGWCRTTLPSPQTLNDVWSAGDGTAWAVSQEGNVLHYDGTAWTVQFTVLTPLLTIWGTAPNDLWIGGKSGLYHGQPDAGGAIVWTAIDFGELKVQVKSIASNAAGDMWFSGASDADFKGRLYAMPVGTTTWTRDLTARTDIADIKKVLVAGNGDLWLLATVGGSAQRVLHRRNLPAVQWVDENPVYDKLPLDPNPTFWGMGFAGDKVWVLSKVNYSVSTYWIGTNDDVAGTMSWTKGKWVGATNPLADALTRYDVWGASDNDVWTIGDYGQIHHWDGTAWRIARTSVDGKPIVTTAYAMSAHGNDDIWVVGDKLALHKISPQAVGGAK